MNRKPSAPRFPAHRCAAPGCDKVVPGEILMCYPHWRLVPGPNRRAVTAAWLAATTNPADAGKRTAYAQARAAAIKALAEVQQAGGE